jgi:hypothetical protein
MTKTSLKRIAAAIGILAFVSAGAAGTFQVSKQ